MSTIVTTTAPRTPQQQAQWAGSQSASRGLNGCLVASRLKRSPTTMEIRELILWLQSRSFAPDPSDPNREDPDVEVFDVEDIVHEALAVCPEHFTTPTLFARGLRDEAYLDAETSRIVRDEVVVSDPIGRLETVWEDGKEGQMLRKEVVSGRDHFLLPGEFTQREIGELESLHMECYNLVYPGNFDSQYVKERRECFQQLLADPLKWLAMLKSPDYFPDTVTAEHLSASLDLCAYLQRAAYARTPGMTDPRDKLDPQGWRAHWFESECFEVAKQELYGLLEELCLRPESPKVILGRWWFQEPLAALLKVKGVWEARQREREVVTSVGQHMAEIMEHAAVVPGLYVITCAEPGSGTSYAAAAHCDLYPGRFRYLKVPSMPDKTSVLAEWSGPLGLGAQRKVTEQLRRVCEVLESGLIPVFDDAMNFVPQKNPRDTRPIWLEMATDLVRNGVSVILAAGPDFLTRLAEGRKHGRWSLAEFDSLAAPNTHLVPNSVTWDDMVRVCRRLFPEADADIVLALACHAYCAKPKRTIRQLRDWVNSARAYMRQAGRDCPDSGDVQKAVNGFTVRSDATVQQLKAAQEKPVAAPAPRRTPKMISTRSGAPAAAPRNHRGSLAETAVPA